MCGMFLLLARGTTSLLKSRLILSSCEKYILLRLKYFNISISLFHLIFIKVNSIKISYFVSSILKYFACEILSFLREITTLEWKSAYFHAKRMKTRERFLVYCKSCHLLPSIACVRKTIICHTVDINPFRKSTRW